MKIALLQMDIQERNKDENVKHGLELLAQAAVGQDVVVMPEIWTTGYSLGHIEQDAETMEGPVIAAIKTIARENKCNIVAGSMPMKIEGKIYNTSVVIDRNGAILDYYSKFHLFGLFHEERFFAPGKHLATYQLDGIECSNTICYDLRFPEMFRHLALAGAKMIFIPAEWPTPRGDVWKLLVQARAIENHIFICAVNCTGFFKGEPFYGNSMIVSPTGKIIVEGDEKEAILYGDIDLEDIKRVRNRINVLNDVREEFTK